MLHLPRPSATHVARPRAPSTSGSAHSSDRSPSPTASTAPPPTISSPASSFAPLATAPAAAGLRQGGWRPYTERQPILVRGPRRDSQKKVDDMSFDELTENLNRNQRVLSDRSIFPPRRPSSPPDPHEQKLRAMQAQLEQRMGLLSTQDGVANLSVDGAGGAVDDFGLGRSPEQGTGSYRRLSTQTSPVFRNPTPKKIGRTDPLGMDEALSLQSALFAREQARALERQQQTTLREEQRVALSLGLGAGVTGVRLQDELERIRAAARMRAFMNPKQSHDAFSDDELDEVDELTAAFEADDNDYSDDGDGNGGLMVISQEEMERSWRADGEGTTG